MGQYSYEVWEFLETAGKETYVFRMPRSAYSRISEKGYVEFHVFSSTEKMLGTIYVETHGRDVADLGDIRPITRPQIEMIGFFDQMEWKPRA